MDQGAVVVILLGEEGGGVEVVHPGGHVLGVVVSALAGDGIYQHRAAHVPAAEQADALDHLGGDPPGVALFVDLKLGSGEDLGGVVEAQVAHDVAVEGLRVGILDALRQADHLRLLGHHIHDDVGGQALLAVGQPLEEVGVIHRGHPHRPALVVDLAGVEGVLKLGHHIAQSAHLPVAQIVGRHLAQGGDLLKGDLGHILHQVARLHVQQLPVVLGPEHGDGGELADEGEGGHRYHDDEHGLALILHVLEVDLDALDPRGVRPVAVEEQGQDDIENTQEEEDPKQIPRVEVDGGQGEVEQEQSGKDHNDPFYDKSLAALLFRRRCTGIGFVIQVRYLLLCKAGRMSPTGDRIILYYTPNSSFSQRFRV